MALQDHIDKRYKKPSVEVSFGNGAKPRDIINVEVSRNLSDAIGTATITTTSRTGVSPEERVVIKQGYNGDKQMTFTGIVDSIEHNSFEETWTFSCRDLLKKAMDTFLCQEIKFGLDVDKQLYYYSTYSDLEGGTFTVHEYESLGALTSAHPETSDNYTNEGVKAEAVVQWLLIMTGLNEGSEIQVDPTNFFIGDLTPATFYLTSVFDAIQQICELIGWYIYCDVSGVVHFKQKPRAASGYYVWNYSDSKNIHSIHDITSNTDLRNYVEVHGYSGIKHVARQPSPYLGTTAYRGVVIGNDFIDTPEIASFVANRVLADLNRLKTTIQMTVDGNPYLFPGGSLRVSSRVATGAYLIEQISTTMSAEGGYKMTVQCTTYPGSIFEEPPQDIIAEFTTSLVASFGDPKLVVELDGSASHSSRGPIVSWDWVLPTKEDTGVVVWGVFDYESVTEGLTQDVTLTVKDGLGNVGTITKPMTLSDLTQNQVLKFRQLYGALTTKGVGSKDGGNTWNSIDIPAISVAASNFNAGGVYTTSGYALFGGSDGNIYKTTDVCSTYTIIYTADSAVNDIDIPELNSLYVVAGTENGAVYTSEDAGETWIQKSSFSSPVQQVRYAYLDHTQLLAIAGGNVYDSYDSGDSWSQVTMPVASGINWNSAGTATNYFAHPSGIVTIDGHIAFNGGVGPSIEAMTIAIDNNSGIMAVDTIGQHWNYSGGAMYATQFNADNLTSHMLRDGEIHVVNYYATQSGVSKSLDRNNTIQDLYYPSGETMPAGGWGKMVAYGPLAPIIPKSVGRLVIHASKLHDALKYTEGDPDPIGTDVSRGLFFANEQNQWVHVLSTDVKGGIAGPGFVALYANLSYINVLDMTVPSGERPKGYGRAFDVNVDHGGVGPILGLAYKRGKLSGFDLYAFINHYSDGVRVHQWLKLENNAASGQFNGQFGSKSLVAEIIDLYGFYGGHEYTSSTNAAGFVRQTYFAGHPMNRTAMQVLWNLETGDHEETEKTKDVTAETYFRPFMAKFDSPWGCMGATGSPVGRVSWKQEIDPETGSPDPYSKLWHGTEGGGAEELPTELLNTSQGYVHNMFDSCLNRTDVYWASKKGIYRTTSYGLGETEELFRVPDDVPNANIDAFSVTHNRIETADYIAAVYTEKESSGDAFSGQAIVSLDGGITWQNGPSVRHGDWIRNIWYVVE